MSHRICLASDPLASGFPTDKSALWVHHKKDAVPDVATTIDAESFNADPMRFASNVDCVVFVNLVSRIVRPGTRMKYSQAMTDPWNGPPRLSVDSHAFIAEPWRMWWHFGAVMAPLGEPDEKYHTSYRVETDWKRYLEDKTDNPCTMDRLVRYGSGLIVSRDGFRFTRIDMRLAELGSKAHQEYAIAKEEAFESCKTPTALLKQLSDFAQKVCPERTVPKDLYAAPSPEIVLTDLGIDRYLWSRMQADMQLTNDIAEAFA